MGVCVMKNEVFEKFIYNRKIGSIILDDYMFVRVQYDDRFDYLLDGWGKLEFSSSYRQELELSGLIDNKTHKVYTDNGYRISKYTCDDDVYDIGKLTEEVITKLNDAYNKYIYENKEEFCNIATSIFNTYMSYDENASYLKQKASEQYIIVEDISAPIVTNFKYSSLGNYDRVLSVAQIIKYIVEGDKFIMDSIMAYLEKDGEEKVYSGISGIPDIKVTRKEKIGFQLICNNKYLEYFKEFSENPNSWLNTRRKIYQCLDIEKMKTVNIMVKHNDIELIFKYPAQMLSVFNISDWHIPDLATREKFKNLFKDVEWHTKDDTVISSIQKITYGKNILYEK